MVAPDLPIGDRIRHHRGSRRQDVVAGLVGIAPDYLSQIERGKKLPSLPILYAIARELGVSAAALLSASPPTDGQDSDNTGPGIVQALMGYGPPRSAPASHPDDLYERVAAAWQAWQGSPTRFTDVAPLLPDLISDVEHLARSLRTPADAPLRREALRASADLYFLLRSYLRRTGRPDLSMMAADRAVRAAEDADDPLRIAAAQWNLGHALLSSHEVDGAEQVALLAVDALASAPLRGDERVAMTGALHLVAVVAAARRRDWSAARDRLRKHATPAARQCGDDSNIMWTVFGPTNVELHMVSVELEAGEASEALRMADEINTRALPSIERGATFMLEVARCYDLRREDAAVLLHLLELEEVAPEDLARNPMARDLIRGVLRRARAMHARQAQRLAERIGVL
ncbi:helix-turn-helix domain-containing protein [Streptomyces sp. 796.1]|uniref:helix-turn-helix domain-containing protein n=1 Tax=Streptomyces sp. 796.1 TaxID=3163029 RepID=UPI0039C98D51